MRRDDGPGPDRISAAPNAAREPRKGERFRAYLTIDDEVAIYCPECAEREFGGENERRAGESP